MTSFKFTASRLGKSGEDVAAKHLRKKKYKIIERGFRLFRGEIDIIAYDKKTLVFCEVKTRQSTKFGRPEEAVTPAKQRQLRKIAEGYCAFHKLADVACRFDVLSVLFDETEGFSVDHIEDAF